MFDSEFFQSAEKCKVYILMDSSNNKQFNGLMEVMKRLHAPLPKDWIHAAKVSYLK